MKRFWIGVGLLGALLVLGTWGSGRLRRSYMPCAADLDNAAAYAMAEDWVRAEGLTERARNSWEQDLHITAAIHDHQPLEDIDALFRELEIYRAREDTVSFCAVCVQLAQRLKDLGMSGKVSWWNLF
jgi:hypothetical protein